jgi:hypothetical protein
MSKIRLNAEYTPGDISVSGNDKVIFPNTNDNGRLWFKDASGAYPLDGNDEARFRAQGDIIDGADFATNMKNASKLYSLGNSGFAQSFVLQINTAFTGNNDTASTWRVIELFEDSSNNAVMPPIDALTTGVHYLPAMLTLGQFSDITVKIRSNTAMDGLVGDAAFKLGYFTP